MTEYIYAWLVQAFAVKGYGKDSLISVMCCNDLPHQRNNCTGKVYLDSKKIKISKIFLCLFLSKYSGIGSMESQVKAVVEFVYVFSP